MFVFLPSEERVNEVFSLLRKERVNATFFPQPFVRKDCVLEAFHNMTVKKILLVDLWTT